MTEKRNLLKIHGKGYEHVSPEDRASILNDIFIGLISGIPPDDTGEISGILDLPERPIEERMKAIEAKSLRRLGYGEN